MNFKMPLWANRTKTNEIQLLEICPLLLSNSLQIRFSLDSDHENILFCGNWYQNVDVITISVSKTKAK